MLEETFQAKERFESITGIKVQSIKKNTGSMKMYYTVRLSTKDKVVADFVDNYYKNGGNRNLNGVNVKFMQAEYMRDIVQLDVSMVELV